MPINFRSSDFTMVFTHIFPWEILRTCFWPQILRVKTIDMFSTTDFMGQYCRHVFWPELLWANTVASIVFTNSSSGQKTCQWYLPVKYVVKSMSIVFTHKICDQKHVHSICQSKIWVNTILQSGLQKCMGIFHSIEITINTYRFFTVEKGDRFFPIDFTVLKP